MVAALDELDAAPALQGVRYQNVLRSIGAYLDEQNGAQISIVETEEGFLVRYQARHLLSQLISVNLGMDDVALRSRRGGSQRSGTARIAGPPATRQYQDILRALGYELEHAAARHIALDELDGGYVLAYYAPDTEDATRVRKHRMILSPAETEQIVRRARGRRRSPAPGWLLESSIAASDPVSIIHMTDATPVFCSTPSVVLDYTIPALTAKATAAILQSGNVRVASVYRASQGPQAPQTSPEERLLGPFEAARLITAVYARCLDPVRFPGAAHEALRKGQIIGAFARALSARKMVTAAEHVADHIEDLRLLDEYQAGLGTTSVRWMQYLASEVLSADPPVWSGEQMRLCAALARIRRSETAVDRFAAIRQLTPGDTESAE